MSKPIEQTVMPVAGTTRTNATTADPKQPNTKEADLSTLPVLIAIAVFACMVGLFAYGFHAQQQRMERPDAASAPPLAQSPVAETGPNAAAVGANNGTPMVADSTAGRSTASVQPDLQSRHADVHFDFGKTRLRADAIMVLQDHAAKMKTDNHWGVLITGYADRHGSAGYNRTLAMKRGEAVKQFLVELGVPADSMKVVSLGQEAALCDDESPTCKRLTRRVHLEFVKLEAPIAVR